MASNTPDFLPKPERGAFEAIFAMDGVTTESAAMFEDDPRNLRVRHDMGMKTRSRGPRAAMRRAYSPSH